VDKVVQFFRSSESGIKVQNCVVASILVGSAQDPTNFSSAHVCLKLALTVSGQWQLQLFSLDTSRLLTQSLSINILILNSQYLSDSS